VFSFLFQQKPVRPLLADMHAHWLPGVDDGVKTIEESMEVIDRLMELGYEKLTTTPHIMSDFYGNSSASLKSAFDHFITQIRAKGYTLPLHCAAEYYIDEGTINLINNVQELLTFGKGYLLFETNMISEPMQLKDIIFKLTSQGYKPVIAHPERYQYMTMSKAEDLRNRGVLLQINMLSLIGYYGPTVQKMAARLIDKGWVDLLGSDCHHIEQGRLLGDVWKTRLFRKASALPLLNYTL